MAKYVKVEDVVDFINGLDSLPFEEETADMVNRLDIYDTDSLVERVKLIALPLYADKYCISLGLPAVYLGDFGRALRGWMEHGSE